MDDRLLLEEARVLWVLVEVVMEWPFDVPEGKLPPSNGDAQPLPGKVWERRLTFSIAERKWLRNHAPEIIHGRRDETS
ncbi:hypothetical protein [Brevibacterium marinum]|uniref:Uncharacterized protein n=1 Tax=Brevibacterium marinum TaxID=418643 RepID=A0A846RWX4_9MICO|nr:hypothetical protein [Brevibacterium marinum]NJC56466.1 hypothetical protein [Brevibacterium marinum]